MVISLSIIITIAVLLVLALVTPLFSPYFRRIEEEEGKSSSADGRAKDVSILIVEHDSSYHLQRVLPELLAQKYEGNFQVVVVIDQNDSESEDICKQYSAEYGNLYYTMLPVSSRYISRKKLGMTIGMRAAKYDWVLITDVHCMPTSDEWLSSVASHIDDRTSLVMGVASYEEETDSYYCFDQLRTMLYSMRLAQKGTAYITNMPLLMMRKSEFFNGRGFHGNLECQRAEFEFLVNKFAKPECTRIAIEPESRMVQFSPTSVLWKSRMLHRFHARSYFERSASFLSLFFADAFFIQVFNILTLVSVVVGLLPLLLPELAVSQFGISELDGMVLAGASAFVWIVSQVERYLIYDPVIRYFDGIGTVATILYEWILPVKFLVMWLRYRYADKNDFITHKL